MAEEVISNASRYSSALFLCLTSSIGFCLAFLPILPQNPDFPPSAFTSKDFMLGSLTVTMILCSLISLWILFHRRAYHRDQILFWPMQCYHCARAFGISNPTPETLSPDTETFNSPGPASLQRASTFNDSVRAVSHACNIQTSHSSRDTVQKHLGLRESSRGLNSSVPGASGLVSNPPKVIKSIPSQPDVLVLEKDDPCELLPVCLPSGSSYHRPLRDGDVDVSTDVFLCSVSDETSRDQISCETRIMEDSYIIVASGPNSTSGENQSNNLQSRHNKEHLNIQGLVYTKPHKSLINIFQFFTALTVLGILVDTIQSVKCILRDDQSTSSNSFHVFENILYLITNLIALLFFRTFYGAVFVDKTSLSYTLAFFFGMFFFVSMKVIAHPISEFGHYNQTKTNFCMPHGDSFWRTFADPFYEECAITGAAICLQMWTSILPLSTLKVRDQTAEYEEIKETNTWSDGCKKPGRSLSTRFTLVFSFAASVAYFAGSRVLSSGKQAGSLKYKHAYLSDVSRLVFFAPPLILCIWHLFVTRSFPRFRATTNIPNIRNLIGVHDVMLLFSGSGVFTLHIFRIISAAIELSQEPAAHHHIAISDKDILLWVTFVISCYDIVRVVLTTLVLLVAQRQQLQGARERKWARICLMYLVAANITQWLEESTKKPLWLVLSSGFGLFKGEIIGMLLNPFITIYSLHSATVAYEIFKSI